jgi:tryptophan 7-halogenase
MMSPVNVIVVGGGTAGWLAANILNRRLNSPGRQLAKVTLIESKNIGRIGVGEATVPRLKEVLTTLGVDEYEFMRRTNATFKHAIRYNNWQRNPVAGRPDHYYHPFENFQAERKDSSPRYYGAIERLVHFSQSDVTNYWWHRAQTGQAQSFAYEIGIQPYLCDAFRAPKTATMPPYQSEVPYAYHLDAQLFADYLTEIGLGLGIRHVVDEVTSATLTEQGAIGSVHTKEHGAIVGDFFIDCSGFAALLIGKTLNVPFIDYGQYLLCDRAIAMPTPLTDSNPRPYTSATAADAGWIWEIDLTNRSGNGYVYSSNFISDDDAEKYLRSYVGARAEGAKTIRLKMPPGRRAQMWSKNCVAIGLAGGFVEPLESTGIMFIDIGANWLAEFFPFNGELPQAAARYNSIMASQYDEIRDFITLHYCISQRDDTPFWREVRQRRHIPDSLAERLDLWSRLMPRSLHLRESLQIYNHRNYECILFGMGWKPEVQGGRQGMVEPPTTDQLFKVVQSSLRKALVDLPTHADVLREIQRRPPRVEPPHPKEFVPGTLEPGVVLVSQAANSQRIKLSAGSQTIAEAQIDSAKYKADARLPKEPWHSPSQAEYSILTDPRRVTGIGSYVSIMRLEPETFEELSAIGRQAASLELHYDRPMLDGTQERAIELVVRHIGRAYSEPNSIYRSEGVTVSPPGTPTTTYDLSDNRWPGLHLDGWSGLSPIKRDEAFNRMCINIGQESRQFLYINLSMRRIIEMLSEFHSKLETESPSTIGRLFMARFPEYPVISLDIAPGEGYIAPTENIIHDGTTAKMTKPDVVLSLLGRFRPVPVNPINKSMAAEQGYDQTLGQRGVLTEKLFGSRGLASSS